MHSEVSWHFYQSSSSLLLFSNQALNKKEHKPGESPDQEDPHIVLTPRTEENYKKIDRDYQMMMEGRFNVSITIIYHLVNLEKSEDNLLAFSTVTSNI